MPHRISLRKSARLFLAIPICLGLLTASPLPGKADIAPEPWAPGSDIGPTTTTQVRMDEPVLDEKPTQSRT
jgi:hypothetical protein